MDKEFKTTLCEITLGASIFAAGFLFGKYSTDSTPATLKEPDISINRPEFQIDLTLSDRVLVEKYGKESLLKLLEANMLDMYGELQSPELKSFYNGLHIRYLEMKLEALRKINTSPNSTEPKRYNHI